jgi:mycoredoxin
LADTRHTAVERWLPSASLTGVAVLVLSTDWAEVGSAVVSAILLVLAWLVSPWFYPRSRSDGAARNDAAAADVPLVYWRPGCFYCLRLRLVLGRIGIKAVWVDVSRDGDASARVRSVNGGDETVPTVFVRGSAWTNPAPTSVRRELRVGRNSV